MYLNESETPDSWSIYDTSVSAGPGSLALYDTLWQRLLLSQPFFKASPYLIFSKARPYLICFKASPYLTFVGNAFHTLSVKKDPTQITWLMQKGLFFASQYQCNAMAPFFTACICAKLVNIRHCVSPITVNIIFFAPSVRFFIHRLLEVTFLQNPPVLICNFEIFSNIMKKSFCDKRFVLHRFLCWFMWTIINQQLQYNYTLCTLFCHEEEKLNEIEFRLKDKLSK